MSTTRKPRHRRRDDIAEAVKDSGARGLTWVDVSEHFGTHHGSASSALSLLAQDGVIVRLRSRRGGSSVYVFPEHADPGDIAPPRKAHAAREALDDSYDKGWNVGYDAGLAAARATPIPQETIDRYRSEGAERYRRELLGVTTAMLRILDPSAATHTHPANCWQNHPACAVRAFRRKLQVPGV